MSGHEADKDTHEATPARTDEGTVVDIPRQAARLIDLLEAHRGERHVVVLHDFPDPDAISAAFAHKIISDQFEIEVDILYQGAISHQQNIALVRLLGIDLLAYDRQETDLTAYDGAVFVDNQGNAVEEIVEALAEAGAPILIVVDHHERQDRLEPAYADIRRIGSTATIYAEYLQAGLLTLDTAQRGHIMLATALMHGILTDTGHFIQAGIEDFHAAAFLSQYSDSELLRQIMSQARSRVVMEIIRRAVGDRVTIENYSIAGIGYLRAQDRDAIPQAADFLLTEENVHTAIVYGIVSSDREEALVGSMRTSKITIDPDDFIKTTLGHDCSGRYFGGGKTLAGGFEIPIDFLAGDSSDEFLAMKWEVYDRQIKQKIYAKIGAQPE